MIERVEKSGDEGTKLFRVNWSIKQLASGEERFEIKVRADTIEEAKALMGNSRDELLKICKVVKK
jgi:ribosome maturation protein Sdo1